MADEDQQFDGEQERVEDRTLETDDVNSKEPLNDGDNEDDHTERRDHDEAPPGVTESSFSDHDEPLTGDGSDNERPGQKILASRDNEDERKIFVGGLSWETTVSDVKDYFNQYGTVLDCTLKTDPATGKSRGFAFVLFEESSSVDKVFNESIHMLNGRKIDPKKALARGGRDPIKKVFVGGLPPDFPLEDIKDYFGKFGKIVEIEQPFDRQKNQRRAFIFITYESEEIVEQVVANPKQTVGGKEVDVRKATPKADQDNAGRGGRGGFGGQRGGSNRGRGESWGQMPVGYPPPGYDYYSSYYGAGYPGYGAYPPGYGYDYSGYYDYSAYYSQPPTDWSSYSGYTAPGYTQPYTGYDYSNWYGTEQSGNGAQSQSASQAGKAKRGSSSTPYHPYSR